jgi:hypothetical protein
VAGAALADAVVGGDRLRHALDQHVRRRLVRTERVAAEAATVHRVEHHLLEAEHEPRCTGHDGLKQPHEARQIGTAGDVPLGARRKGGKNSFIEYATGRWRTDHLRVAPSARVPFSGRVAALAACFGDE